ncbi:MAG: preprotein translocase subunit YajC [Candidatus Paracaedibacteraceae bacterium]|nr:preprotein translocase subunit YajC [Candidatus Paracaedibacteraceae bacterium]
MFLITSAFAASAPATAPTAAGFDPMQLAPMVLIFGVMYFLLIRPQQKKAKQHQETIAAIKKGDSVVTSGGILGVIHKVDSDAEVTVEIAENVHVRVVRSTISNILSKTETTKTKASAAKSAKQA